MLQTQKTQEDKDAKLPAVSERDKAGKEFDDKGKDIEAAKRGTKEDSRLKIVTDKQKAVELDLILRNPNTDSTKKMDELRGHFFKHGINVSNPDYVKDITALQDVIQGKTKLMDAETFKTAKKELDDSVAHTTSLKDGKVKAIDTKELESKLKESYTRLFPK